ncbi:DUF2931 family protein [Oceanicola sp. D3]|uniref:DUF2931 family protein n=1 Tax=Oceanicola sp. D3 TaxID=2587163 RepID=UPI00112190BF|nr:DUF2931 family protein [Oceanicola sp. D3]QDC10744.1 DUF2931 family protein [Oceanicola sp. D3]
MAQYEWLPTECAPRHYPARIVEGILWFEDGSGHRVPSGKLVANGWGRIGSTRVIGEALKPLPVELEISWLSVPEARFYSGAFKLPKSRIARLFREGIEDAFGAGRLPYLHIAVGTAPGGDVTVWCTDGAVCRSVIGFTANPVEKDWASFEPGTEREAYCREAWARAVPEAERERVLNTAPPLGQWGRWRRRFGWTPSLSCPETPRHLWIDGLNGEREIYAAPEWEDPWPDRSAPEALRASWQTAGGEVRMAHVTFDPQESFEALSRFAEARPAELGRIAMEVEISERFPDAAVTLRDSQLALPLEKCKVEVFRQ